VLVVFTDGDEMVSICCIVFVHIGLAMIFFLVIIGLLIVAVCFVQNGMVVQGVLARAEAMCILLVVSTVFLNCPGK
jgi:hypothetical protein